MTDAIRILILDDDPDDAFMVTETLLEVSGTNYFVTSATKPDVALDLLKTESFDLLICDYRMGSVNGTDFIADLPNHEVHLPSILLTGMADSVADALALEAGAVDFVSKSDISCAVLDRTIRYAVANAQRQLVLTSIIHSITAAVCVGDENSQPKTWNPRFTELAIAHSPDLSAQKARNFLFGQILEEKVNNEVGCKKVDIIIARLPDECIIMTLHDVSAHVQALEERTEAVNKADYMARHCSLTGLPNRNALTEALLNAIEQSDRCQTKFSIVVLDLDKFKEVNDVFGHNTGDELLIEASRRMKQCCQASDFLGRMGGDEFLLVSTDPYSGDGLAARLQKAFDSPFCIDGEKLNVCASIGMATYPDHGRTAKDLLANADLAMFRAKANPNVSMLHYNEDIDQQVREQRLLMSDLKVAIDNEDIGLRYQPQVTGPDGNIHGFEALARWTHPTLGAISPMRFIALAEQGGLIEKLGLYVLRQACRAATKWPEHIMVSVNVSADQISNPGFARLVHEVLLETGLNSKRLELEVTETVIIEDVNKALFVMRGIKELGVSLAIDDFGTGHSSLTTLAAFPFDRLKIDKSFVQGMSNDTRLATVVRSCIGLSTSLNIAVIAEGVETEEQVDTLLSLGCDQFQGYYFGKPCPLLQADLIANHGKCNRPAPLPKTLVR